MRKTRYSVLPFFIFSALLLAACNGGTGAAGLSGTSWTLVSYGPVSSQVQAMSGVQTSLVFGSDGQVSGNVGCNSFGGDYAVKNGQITFGPIISTMMACPGEVMTQESAVLQVLKDTVSYTVANDMLTITNPDGDQVIKFTNVATP